MNASVLSEHPTRCELSQQAQNATLISALSEHPTRCDESHIFQYTIFLFLSVKTKNFIKYLLNVV